jgi:glutathione S-transferase
MITVTAFKWVPPFARGLVRDLRVRWALEEAGLRYEVRLLADGEKDGADYRAWQPFGQVPAYEENGLKLFESGAIVLRIAERSENAAARRSGGPGAGDRMAVRGPEHDRAADPESRRDRPVLRRPGMGEASRPDAEAAIRKRLAELAAALGDKPFLDGPRFTAGDLMMATVLRILRHIELVAEAGLADYLARCETRPAFQRALAGQIADFTPTAD